MAIIICAILANKRLYQLSDAAVLTDKYIAIDKAGSSEAERYPITNFPTTTYVTNNFAPIDVDYKCNEVAVVAGAIRLLSLRLSLPRRLIRLWCWM